MKSKKSNPPIKVIPPELLGEIFHFLASMVDPFKTWNALNTITATCSQWRAVAISHHRIWSRLELSGDTKPAVELIRLWVFRSGDTPLDLLLHWHDNYEDELDTAEVSEPVDEEEEYRQAALRALIPTCSRWRTLDIKPTLDSLDLLTTLNEPLNNLKSIRFSSDPPAILYELFEDEKPFVVFSNAPALKTVVLDSQEPFMLPVPWPQLRSYHLLGSSAGACLWLIQQCVKLVKCTMVISDLEDHGYYQNHPPVDQHTLPDLQLWTIKTPDQADIPKIFNKVTTPALTKLRLQRQIDQSFEETSVTGLSSLLIRSSCTLSHLELTLLTLTMSELVDILQQTPMLIDLRVSVNPFCRGDLIFTADMFKALTRSRSASNMSLLGMPLLVPQLRSCMFRGKMVDDFSYLVELIASRIGKSGWEDVIQDSQIIEKLRLEKVQEAGPVLESPLLRNVLLWKKEGYCVSINGYPKVAARGYRS